MINSWFKMYGGEYLSDPKMKSLSACERSCWSTLLCYASISKVPGTVQHLSEKQLMIDAGVDPSKEEWKRTIGVLNRFLKLDMVTVDNGMITIVNWFKKQERAMTGYERIKKHRDKMKHLDNEKVTDDNEAITPSSVSVSVSVSSLKEITDRFEKFWGAYPRKVSKKKAFEKWQKMKPSEALLEKMLQSIEQQSKSTQWTKDGGDFIPHPTTWLNQERWNDELVRVGRPKVGGGKFDNLPTKKA